MLSWGFSLICGCTCASAQDSRKIPIVPSEKVGDYWIAKGKFDPSQLDRYSVKGIPPGTMACINMGFIIESSGDTSNLAILKAAVDSKNFAMFDASKPYRMLGLVAFTPFEILRYRPGLKNQAKEALLTNFPFVYLDARLDRQLSVNQRQELVSRIRLSCVIGDLRGWITSHGMNEPVVVELPNVDDILTPSFPK